MRTAIPEEARDHPRQIAVGLIHSHLDLEVALFGIAQDVRERLGVGGRGAQLLQPGIAIARGGHDQRVTTGGYSTHGGSGA